MTHKGADAKLFSFPLVFGVTVWSSIKLLTAICMRDKNKGYAWYQKSYGLVLEQWRIYFVEQASFCNLVVCKKTQYNHFYTQIMKFKEEKYSLH